MARKFQTQHIDSRDGSLFAVERTIDFDRFTGSYRDGGNDVFVVLPHNRKRWIVSSREAGNQIAVHSRHNDIDSALDAAVIVARAHYGDANRATQVAA